jgi:hypothetical protein
MPSGMVLHDVAIHQNNGTAWASLASKSMIGRNGTVIRDAAGKIKYTGLVGFTSRELGDRFSASIIAALRDRYSEALS